VLVTNTVIRVSGTTETAVTVSGTAVPAPATCTGILPSCDIGATLTPATTIFANNALSGSQVYTFKNYASTSQTVTGIQLSDTADYSITSDTCSGATLGSLHTCTFTLLYSAKGAGNLDTKVSVVQTVNGATTTLAFAGTAAAVAGGISVSPTNMSFSVTIPGPHCISPCQPAGLAQNFTITNIGFFPETLGYMVTGGFGVSPNGNVLGVTGNCPTSTTLGAGQSCTAIAVGPSSVGNFTGTITVTGGVGQSGVINATASVTQGP
jgi:hypothetical protein